MCVPVVDDSSPLISYTGGWADTPLEDSLAQSYLAHSLHTSSAPGATATFTFNGTGIWLYGGRRPNYGAFKLAVDGRTVMEGKASASNNAVGQLLGGATSLGMGQHTAVLTVSGTGPVDLDNLIFETHIGSQSYVFWSCKSYQLLKGAPVRTQWPCEQDPAGRS